MDMTSTAEAARWYDNPRLGGGGSPNTGGGSGAGPAGAGNGIGPLGNSHVAAAAMAAANGGGLDASDMGAFYALENGSRRYYSGHYSPHGKCLLESRGDGVSVLLVVARPLAREGIELELKIR